MSGATKHFDGAIIYCGLHASGGLARLAAQGCELEAR
jgi:hypothetical protein